MLNANTSCCHIPPNTDETLTSSPTLQDKKLANNEVQTMMLFPGE